MMTNYDVLMNSTEEECCKLLEKHIVQGDFIPDVTRKINEKRRKANER